MNAGQTTRERWQVYESLTRRNGSLTQLGEVKAIGGVTHKVEGFFDACAMRGLTGTQGVIIPVTNVGNLMLREDVVEAARDGRFQVWAVRTADEALAILTGLPADTVNAQVDSHVREFADRLKAFGRSMDQGETRERTPAPVGPRTPRVQGINRTIDGLRRVLGHALHR